MPLNSTSKGCVNLSLFPVTYSLLSKQALLSHIKDHYEFQAPLQLQYFLRGMNDTYILKTGSGPYLFRVYRADRRNESEIAFELDLLNHLKANHVSVSIPIAKKDGTFINEFVVTEGVKYGVMFSFAEGREKPIHHVEDSYLFGESVAQMHTATGHFQSEHARDSLDLEFLMDRPLELIQLHMQHRPDDYHFICEKMSELKKRLATKIEAGLDWGICHGDLHGNTNTAFTEDGALTHYDFDISGYGWRAYDIAEFRLAREIHSGHDPEEVERLWEAFLSGYRKVRDLSDNDVAAVALFVVLRQLWLFGLCFSESELVGGADFDEGFIDSKMEYFRNVVF